MVAAQQIKTAKHSQTFELRRLSDEEVKSVRQDWLTGRVTQKQLAHEFGVSQSCINHIVNGKRRVTHAASFKREFARDGKEHFFIYGASGEQLKEVETEEMARAEVGEANLKQRRVALEAEKRAVEKRLREINNEIADIDRLPF